jgi:hypothetical protein
MVAKVIFCLLCGSLSVGCQSSSHVPPHSGIEFKLSSPDGEAPLRPDGLFRVEGLDGSSSVHVPLTPVEPGSSSQRVELPPGSYKVSYLPVELVPSLHSLQHREPVRSSSPNAFIVVVSKGQFSTLEVHAVDAASARPVLERSALGPPRRRDQALDAAVTQPPAAAK